MCTPALRRKDQFRPLSSQNQPGNRPLQANSDYGRRDKFTSVPNLSHKRIIRVCRVLKEGSARTIEIVNQGTTRTCSPSAAQGMPLCAPQTPPESLIQGRKQHRYPRGKTGEWSYKRRTGTLPIAVCPADSGLHALSHGLAARPGSKIRQR